MPLNMNQPEFNSIMVIEVMIQIQKLSNQVEDHIQVQRTTPTNLIILHLDNFVGRNSRVEQGKYVKERWKFGHHRLLKTKRYSGSLTIVLHKMSTLIVITLRDIDSN